MSDSYIQSLFAERIGGDQYGKSTAIYKFEKIKRAKAEAKKNNPDLELIDMGVGEPDEMAFPEIVERLNEESTKKENRGYSDNGGIEFKTAAAEYMQNLFGVSLNPQTEIIHSIGSKAALSILPACFINPDDVVLMTVPGYGVFGVHSKYYGGEVFNLKLTSKNNFLPDMDSIPEDIIKRAKVLVLNYPNNPTGAVATVEFFETVIKFAKAHNIIVIHDAAYAALIYSGKPLSILSIPGGKDVALELHSLSKSFNMTGWRIGWVCGNPLLVKAYGDLKDNTDSGQFLAIQNAAALALRTPTITEKIATKYSRRMDMLIEVLNSIGFKASKPQGSFFLYTKAPKSVKMEGAEIKFSNAEECSQWLIKEKLISTVPWDDAGSFVRFSVTFAAKDESEEKEIIEEIKNRLAELEFIF